MANNARNSLVRHLDTLSTKLCHNGNSSKLLIRAENKNILRGVSSVNVRGNSSAKGIHRLGFTTMSSIPKDNSRRGLLDGHSFSDNGERHIASNEIKHTRVTASESLPDTLNALLNDSSFIARVVDHNQGGDSFDVDISELVDEILDQCNHAMNLRLSVIRKRAIKSSLDDKCYGRVEELIHTDHRFTSIDEKVLKTLKKVVVGNVGNLADKIAKYPRNTAREYFRTWGPKAVVYSNDTLVRAKDLTHYYRSETFLTHNNIYSAQEIPYQLERALSSNEI